MDALDPTNRVGRW